MESAKVLKLKFDTNYDSYREIIMCEHKTENPCPEKPLKRTLFLSKVPPWANEEGLKRVLSINGIVQKVYLSKKPSSSVSEANQRDYSSIDRFLWAKKDTSGFKHAYVVFEKASSLKKALSSMDLSKTYMLVDQENPVSTGVKKWKREYNQGLIKQDQLEDLKKAIEKYVHESDERKEEAKSKAEDEAEPDDDGWVTISRQSRKKSTLGAGKSDKVKARLKAKEARKKKNRDLRNFYKFQLKETKLSKLQELRDKFEADKEKQKKLIAERKFRPK